MSFMHEQDVKRMEEIKEYLGKIQTEITMSGYHDGWTVKWLKEKKVELETQLERYKHKFND
jgi:hypothetical protein